MVPSLRFPDPSSTSLGETVWAWGAELGSLPSFASNSLVALEEPPDPLGLCFVINKMEGLDPRSLRSFELSYLSTFLAGPSGRGRKWRTRKGQVWPL